MGEAHLRWLYRAYKLGELSHFPLQPDLDPLSFRNAVMAMLATVNATNGALFAFMDAERPIGVVGVQVAPVMDRLRAFPHAVWFSEASPRQRVECALKFLLDLKHTHLVVIEAKEPDWRFFEHLCKYGLLRRVGTLRDAYGAGGRAAIYQSVGK